MGNISHLGRGNFFSLVCTFKKADRFFFEVKVDVQKGLLRFKEKIDNRCASFNQFTLNSQMIKSVYYELYPIIKNIQWLSNWKVKVDCLCNNSLLISWFNFVYVVEAFITLIGKLIINT